MKKALALILSASLLAGAAGSAQADWGHGRGGYYAPPPHHHHHHRERNWVGPAAVLAITGLALGAAAYSNSYAAPTPVVVAPPPQPVYVAPARESWYFCRSSGQYYPYTNACPEGWIAVPAR